MCAFEKVETKRKYVAVAEQILRAIKEGVYRVGDKLPSERELAEQMGVSRNSVREALSALQVLKIVSSRTGDGTYVEKAVESLDIESQVLPLLKESESPFATFEARAALEVGVAQLAAVRRTPQALQALEAALTKLQAGAAARDVHAYGQANLEFHLALAHATENPVIERMMGLLWESTERGLLHEMVVSYWQSAWEQSLRDHERIVRALQEKDPAKTAEAVRTHYEHAYQHFLRRKEVVIPGARVP
jgi:GntR family transcriptional repressor for pyruvate dehydrogenase complex